MSSCCCPTLRCSGLRRVQSKRCSCSCRCQLGPLLRSFWLCGGRPQQSCTQEILEEMVCGFNYSNSLDNDRVHPTNRDRCCSEESTVSLGEARTMLTLREGRVDGFLQSFVPSSQNRSLANNPVISCLYQLFTTAQQVLGQQFSSTLSPILGTWPDQNLQDTWPSLHCACFEVQESWVQANLYDLYCHAPIIVMPRELLQLTEADAESEVPAPRLLPASPPSAVPDLGQELVPSSCVPGHELQSVPPPAFLGIVAPSLSTKTEPPLAPEETCPWCGTPEHQQHEEQPGLMAFPPKLVAEQLTSIDADLFKKVQPQQCLGSIWSKRNEPGYEHLTCTVSATISQFNNVANCVITTCLGNAHMTARDRAVVVEHWIKVAKACQALRNYSSMHAILSALQSVSIHRLKNTWAKVSRKKIRTFKKLCSKDNPQSRNLLLKVVWKVLG
ncbi:ral guanine nucleotide dissociation stimulator-like [Canis lupus familiaris]|uniref:ral guanine nucleotide dissociation stimulator-like n=1 Tax=Canis lupus familiaris TaxID=9615 RepID=UPI0003AE2649|nr:ral guanine nucleotide dissociation stimulator-like [Canis lupus familiaris]XP_025326795.1 ral guanine nucleotide dissociation stimulator-like [Canis lupus dingo]XP_038302856.1 ral guanine nucleotide dissociation stimulator-like [Canis lupus familiaris]|eukprot:XP_013966145.1 ral guanine nucleotide dissociation stimulator-like [Canis lupus familiaris]